VNLLIWAAALTFLLALGHTIYGEFWIFRPWKGTEGIPNAYNSSLLTKRTLHFVWLIVGVFGFCFSFLFYHLAEQPTLEYQFLYRASTVTFALSFLISFLVSRGRHPAWLIFLVISILVGSRIIL
jgi:hypothetical protein